MGSWFAAVVVVVAFAGCGSVVDVQNQGPDASASKLSNGDTCGTGTDCASTVCVDGVCCDKACDGTCEACNVPGSVGTCSAVPVNTDPATECQPLGTPDAGEPASDGGVQFNLPDGGVTIEAMLCAGSCDGNRACQYPGATKSCGDTFCSTGTEVEKAVCDSAGHCGLTPFECNGYACGDNDCKTSCSVNADCDSDHYCNVGACAPKLGVGTTCLNPTQCGSGYCDNGVCCSSDCSMVLGGNCAVAGGAGQCVCSVNGTPCTTGCKPYYPDTDGDGYGDIHGTPIAGCGDTVPQTGYVADNTDCYDAPLSAHPRASSAFPGSSFYSALDRGDGSFDYNCDGTEFGFYVQRPGAQCGECAPPENLGKIHLCSSPQAGYCAANTTSTIQTYQACKLGEITDTNPVSYNCTDTNSGFILFCLSGQPCQQITGGYVDADPVPCGSTGQFVQCGQCASGTTKQTVTFPVQSCN